MIRRDLYAYWGVNAGLTGGGVITHYAFYYDENVSGPGVSNLPGPTR